MGVGALGSGGVHLAAVVFPAVLRVADKRIGRIDVLEDVRDLRVIRVAVGMIFLGERPIGLLDLGLSGGARYAQNSVWVLHAVLRKSIAARLLSWA